ncbi:MAG: DUF3052 domain-containing protein [Bacteroidia bacterium]
MKSTGYSGTPLAKKLGIKTGFKIKLINQPDYYFKLFTDLPDGIKEIPSKKIKKNFIHYFTKSSSELNTDIKFLRQEIEEDGMIWISWPKKSAKLQADIDETSVRDIALKNDLVDVKVCSVDETWSGLKLVIRLKDRK